MLSPRARAVLDTLLPAGAHPLLPHGILDAGFETFWLDFERSALPALRWGFRLALFAATWIAPLLIRRLPPLTRHDRPTRERALAAMASSRVAFLRQALLGLKTVVAFCYGAEPRVQAALGYPHRRAQEPPAQAPPAQARREVAP